MTFLSILNDNPPFVSKKLKFDEPGLFFFFQQDLINAASVASGCDDTPPFEVVEKFTDSWGYDLVS